MHIDLAKSILADTGKLALHPKVYEKTIQAPTSEHIQKYLVQTRPIS